MTKKKPRSPSQTPFAIWMRLGRLLWRSLPLIVILLAVAAITLFAVRRANGEVVTTFEQLQRATTQPVADVIVVGTIKCPTTLTVTARTFRMTADKQTSGLDFSVMPIAPDWGWGNGMEIRSDNATLYGLTIKGFQARGGCVKFYGFGTLLVDKVTFADIGTTIKPSKVNPAKSADDAHYNNVIASHGTAANVILTNCTFRRCVWTARDWSHCLYTSAGNVVVTDNLFESTGNPVTIDAPLVYVAGNKVNQPVSSPDRFGDMRPAWFATMRSVDDCIYIRNMLIGTMCGVYGGSPNPANHTVNWNDYSGLKVIPPFAADTSKGREISTDEWRKTGFDGATKWP